SPSLDSPVDHRQPRHHPHSPPPSSRAWRGHACFSWVNCPERLPPLPDHDAAHAVLIAHVVLDLIVRVRAFHLGRPEAGQAKTETVLLIAHPFWLGHGSAFLAALFAGARNFSQAALTGPGPRRHVNSRLHGATTLHRTHRRSRADTG